MKISACTFLRNAELLGYPFQESIHSILPLVDEFVIAVGNSDDNTLHLLRAINHPKIKILETQWNENMTTRGYVYGQQKMIAQFACSGDWIFYLEGDEVLHENDIATIRHDMEIHLNNPNVEALVFDYLHFYGNANTYLWSPGWYRREARAIKASVRSYAPDGLYWVVLTKNKHGRYPKAAYSKATIYHYGWVRSQEQMDKKQQKIGKYWKKSLPKINYKDMDHRIFKLFNGTHPAVMHQWLPIEQGLFRTNKDYKPSAKQQKHWWMLKIEKLLGLELSKKHYTVIKQ